MRLTGTRESIVDQVRVQYPEFDAVHSLIRQLVPAYKREIDFFQAAGLYAVAAQYNRPKGWALEIGTAFGYSAAIQARAMPGAWLTTLNPKNGEWQQAAEHLSADLFHNVQVVPMRSDEWLAELSSEARYDFIFVDGDHQYVAADLCYFDRLAIGGMMFFHDYADADSARPCPPVFEALNLMRDGLGRDFDAVVLDDQGVGMVGFERRAGETWAQLNIPVEYAPWRVQYEPVKCWVRDHDW
jgi:predicted O-methyltransferase YrrM